MTGGGEPEPAAARPTRTWPEATLSGGPVTAGPALQFERFANLGTALPDRGG